MAFFASIWISPLNSAFNFFLNYRRCKQSKIFKFNKKWKMKGLHFEWNYLKCLSKITLWPDGNVQSSQEVGTEISPQNPPKVKSRPLHNVEKFCQLEKFCHKPMKHLMSCSQWNVYQKQHYGQMEMFNHHRKLVRNQKVKSRPLYNLEKSCQLEKFCHSPNKWTSLYRHLKRTQTFAR